MYDTEISSDLSTTFIYFKGKNVFFSLHSVLFGFDVCLYLISPYPTVVIVTTAHQNASGIDLKNDISAPASAK